MFRKFKRHYHLVKRAYDIMAESGSISLKLESQGNNLSVSSTYTDKEKTTKFLVLMGTFISEASDLYYKKVFETIKVEFPSFLPGEDILEIERAIETFETGIIEFKINGEVYTPKKIFTLLSDAGFYEFHEEAAKQVEIISKFPPSQHFLWNQFHNYSVDIFRLVYVLFSIILDLEKTEDFKTKYPIARAKTNKCIYCLSENGTFESEEHIIPESLGGDNLYLPKGYVCDKCNNGVSSQLDEALMNFEPIAFLRVQYTSYTKSGKLPKANFQNLVLERTGPRHITYVAKDKTGLPKNERTLEDGRISLNLSFPGKKLNWLLYGRAIYKMGLGLVAYDMGHEAALDSKYNSAREFILNGTSPNNKMIISTNLHLILKLILI